MSPNPFFSLKTAGNRSSALIITLSILVLITAISLTFFIQSTISRQVSFSSAGQYRADAIAHTALDTVTGDLRTEIVAGSQTYTSNGITLYLPTTNFTCLPARVDDQGFTNLVKQSVGNSNFWTGVNYANAMTSPIRAAANNSTTTPSLNGRYIKINRWNMPGLLGDPGSGTTPNIPSSYTPPDWIVITRQGAVTNATTMPSLNVLSDKTATNSSYAVGRFAYTLYDESGLLDINVAGFPGSLSGSTFSMDRGLLPQVDLGTIPGVLNANALVQWRNQTTAASATTYTNSTLMATNGFMTVASGDQAFVSRKDLINYVQANPNQIQSSALQYLGTFTRDSDGPSYYPDPNRPKVSATQDDITNPNVLKIRVQTTFARPDGTQAVVGEPLLKHRFPLSRLALFQNPTANAGLIEKYFAMQARTDGLWDYVDPDTGAVATTLPAIKTLAQVAGTTPAREPDFWELLQAGILTGSLGANSGAFNAFPTTQDASTTRQIFTTGLSIMDQYDIDDTPTVLNLGGTAPASTNDLFVAGVENLPYILWIAQDHFRDNLSVLSPTTNAYIDGYLFFALWNPHRNASSANPGQFRIRCNGQTLIQVSNSAIPSTQYSNSVTHNNTILAFQTTATRNFSQIDALRPSDAILSNTSALAKFPYPSTAGGSPYEVGLLMGQTISPKTPEFPSSGNILQNFYNVPITIVLEKQVGANWIPYQIFPSYQVSAVNNGIYFPLVTAQLNTPNGFTNNQYSALIAMAHSDPRTSRFGLAANGSGVAANMLKNNFNLINTTTGIPFSYLQIPVPKTTTTSATLTLADYAYNTSASGHYVDLDGTIRKGDSNPASTAIHGTDSPFTYGDARPIVLNRPFTSVAEMGYAFRDDPWRSLDFSSQYSADGGLLDLFCLNANDNPLHAGVINLNSASPAVLATILTSAYRDPSSTNGTPLASTDAATIAQAIRSQLGPVDNPLLVLQNVANLPTLTSQIASSLPDTFKFKREAFARSFADIANTRTWNLMIDVIAQAGRYNSASKSLNDFVVEGERRYWIHVAIDRFTGEIVDSQIEPVPE